MRQLFAVLLVAMALPVYADIVNWTTNSPGAFNDAGNWTSISGANVVPGPEDSVLYSSVRVSSPPITVFPASSSFGIRDLDVSELTTTWLLQGSTVNITRLTTIVGVDQARKGLLALAGPGTVNMGTTLISGVQKDVTAILAVAGGAVLNVNLLDIGGFSGRQGGVIVNGGSINAGGISLESGLLAVGDGAVTVNGVNGAAIGFFGGTGSLQVNPSGNFNVNSGALKVGSGGGTGVLSAQGDDIFTFPFNVSSRFARVQAGAQNVLVGVANGKGTVSLGMNGSLSTTGTLTVGADSGSQGIVAMAGGFGILGPHTANLSATTLILGSNNGIGILDAQSLSQVDVAQLTVGTDGGTGQLTATGFSSTINVSGDASIGTRGGTGRVVIAGDDNGRAQLNVTGFIGVGDGTGTSVGLLDVAGGAVNVGGGFLVGTGKNVGEVKVSGSGRVTVKGTSFFTGFGGNGRLTLQDQSQFTAQDSSSNSVVIGTLNGTGVLDISGHGALFSLGTVTIGEASGVGVGTVRSFGHVFAPIVSIGSAGTGTLSLEGGGNINGSNNLDSLDTLTIGSHGGVGVLRAFDAARAQAVNIDVAIDKGSTGTLSVESDTTFKASGTLRVGSDTGGAGSATVAVSNGHPLLAVGTAVIGRGGNAAQVVVSSGGKFQVAGNATVGSNGSLLVVDPGSVASVLGALAVSGPIAAAPASNANLVAVTTGGKLEVGSTLSVGNTGTGTLLADGAGSLVAVGGATTIGGGGGTGTVVLHGGAKLSSVGNVTVNSGGTLIGSGAVIGTVINSGGRVVPGGSPGVLSISGDYVQSNEGVLSFEVFGPTPDLYDRLLVDGNVDVAGKIELIFKYIPLAGGIFDLVTVGGSADFSKLTAFEVSGIGDQLASLSVKNGIFSVQVQAVPLPFSGGLLTAGCGLLLTLRRRLDRLGTGGSKARPEVPRDPHFRAAA